MKALLIIAIVLGSLILAGGLVVGGYFLHEWQTKNTSNNSNSGGNTPTPQPSPTPPKPTTAATCNADELSLTTAENGGAGAGTLSQNIVLTNIGSRQCTLEGYPGVSLVNANGNQVGSPADRVTDATVQTVTLNVGSSTSAAIFYPQAANFDPGVCTDGATKLRVYPPNDTGYLSVATTIASWCPGFKVAPVQ